MGTSWRFLPLVIAMALVGSALLAASGVPDRGPAPRVLFVCQFGSVKSAIAREIFRRRAAERGADGIAMSRALTPELHISTGLAARLAAEGIDPGRDPLRKLDSTTLNAADYVIVFDSPPPDLQRRDARDWSDVPSLNSDYDNARRILDQRIDALLNELNDQKERSK